MDTALFFLYDINTVLIFSLIYSILFSTNIVERTEKKRRRHLNDVVIIYYNVVVIRCSLTLFETLLKRTETYTKKDFPQLSPTFLGAKVINTNLVWRYLTVAAVASHGNKSYSPFLCWSHFNLISWKLKLQHVFHTFRNLLLKEVKKKYFFN